MKDGSIVEVENVCDHPNDGFEVSGEDLLRYHDHVVATWHTHPFQDCNLSMNDYYGFKNFPYWHHFVIGTDGVAQYYVDKAGKVMRVE